MAENDTPPGDKEPADTASEQSSENTTATMTTLGTAPAWTHIHTPDTGAETVVSVSGEWLENAAGNVEITTHVDDAEVTISMEPARARELAAKLASAASYAEADR
jgi:hypothetical protein